SSPCPGNRSQTTHVLTPQAVTIYYPFHPLVNTEVRVHCRRRQGVEDVWAIFSPDGSMTYVPTWMTIPEVCARMQCVNAPHCSVEALRALRTLVDALHRKVASTSEDVAQSGASQEADREDQVSTATRVSVPRARRRVGQPARRGATTRGRDHLRTP